MPISCGQRGEEKRGWSSIELIAVLLNVCVEGEGGSVCFCAFVPVCVLSPCPRSVNNFSFQGYLLAPVGFFFFNLGSLRRCVFVNVCVRCPVCVCVRVCPPLLPGFNTLCMQRLTTLPSNHILLSGCRRQQQQVVQRSGKKEKRGRERREEYEAERIRFFLQNRPWFPVVLWSL